MLNKEPNERITIKDALNHPWIIKNKSFKEDENEID